jgi:hypothetical protein
MLALNERFEGQISSIPPMALDDIERALRLGTVTPDLSYHAAMLYAQAAGDERVWVDDYSDAPLVTSLRQEMLQQRTQRSIYQLRQAVAAGHTISAVDLKMFQETLGTLPNFADLRKDQSHPTVPAMDLHLIEPIDLDN